MALEDFTTYIEVDDENDIVIVSSTIIDVNTMARDAHSHVTKDYGAGAFGNVEILVDVLLQSGQGGALVGISYIIDAPRTRIEAIAANRGFGVFWYRSTNAPYRIYFACHEAATSDHKEWANLPEPGQRYLTYSRTGTNGVCYIYTDSDRTVLEDTLTITCGTSTYQYSQVAFSNGDPPNTAPQTLSIEIYNLNLQLGNPPNAPTNPNPSDGAGGISFPSTNVEVDVSDPDADSMDVYFYDASDDSLIGIDSGVASGGTASVSWGDLVCNTSYSWYAIADDGMYTTSSATFTFTTSGCPYEFKFPIKSVTKQKYKYKIEDIQQNKYKNTQKSKYKYKAEKQE